MIKTRKIVLYLFGCVLSGSLLAMESMKDAPALPAEPKIDALEVFRQIPQNNYLALLPEELLALVAEKCFLLRFRAGVATIEEEVTLIKIFWAAYPGKKKDDELTKALITDLMSHHPNMDSRAYRNAATSLGVFERSGAVNDRSGLKNDLNKWVFQKFQTLKVAEMSKALKYMFERPVAVHFAGAGRGAAQQ